VRNRNALVPALEAKMKMRTSAEWFAALESADIACGPINTLDEVFTNEHVLARNMRIDMPHPLSGTVPLIGSPLNLSASPVSYRSPPPLLGEHTDSILDEIGYGADDIAKMRDSGAL
jgi:crotonobetainyl-CoA:carnitine CoA-transferase CaiB-like acyl-CoA transferase